MSASVWRKGGYNTFSKNCKEQSKNWKGISVSPMYIDSETSNANWSMAMLDKRNITVEVKELKEVTVAYIRHIGPFKGEVEIWTNLFQKLMAWAGARNLLKCPGTQYFTLFRDDLTITEFSKFKTDVCISVEANTKPNGEVGVSVIPAGKYAVAHFEIDGSEFEQAWDSVYSEWLPQSGYQPDERICFEKYLNDPKTHPKNKHIIEVCIPVIAI
jgi:AraC family transcriptional regulator